MLIYAAPLNVQQRVSAVLVLNMLGKQNPVSRLLFQYADFSMGETVALLLLTWATSLPVVFLLWLAIILWLALTHGQSGSGETV